MADFTITTDNVSGVVLPPGQSATVTVRFGPSVTGAQTATLVFTDDSGGSPTTQSIILNGTGVTSGPNITVIPDTSIAFPNTVQGGAAVLKNVLVRNDGNANLIIGTIAVSGANASEFPVTSDTASGTTIAPAGSKSFNVGFTPASVGGRSATITIPNNDDTNHTISLTGTGTTAAVPTATLSTSTLPFPQTTVGVASSPLTVTVTNTTGGGSANLVTTQATITGTNAASFSITSDTFSNHTIAALGTGAVQVTYTPLTATEVASATLNLFDNSGGISTSQPVALTGTGKAALPAVSLSVGNLAFPNTNVGSTSSALPVTVTDSGGGALITGQATITGGNSGDFSIFADTVSNRTIASAGTGTFQIKFSPTASGSRSAILNIFDNASNSPQIVGLGGTGTNLAPGATLSPNPIAFATTAIGSSSATQTLTITNSGNADLIISRVAVSGPFSVQTDNATGQTVIPTGNCTVVLKFTPTAVGGQSGTVVITDNAGTQRANLGGTGTLPSVVPYGHTTYALYFPTFGLSAVEGFGSETYNGWQQTVPAPLGGGTHTFSAPGSIASDYYPADYWSGATGYPPALYSSSDPVVLKAQCLAAIQAGINVLAVAWSPPPDRSDTLITPLLTAAAAATAQTGTPLYIAFMIEPFASSNFTDPGSGVITGGRSASTLWHAVNYINSTYGTHTNFYRTARTGWNYAGRVGGAGIFFINHPEYDYLSGGSPNTSISGSGSTFWQTANDNVHNSGVVARGGLMLAESSFQPNDCNHHHFDGGFVHTRLKLNQAGVQALDLYQYMRTYELGFPPTAICVPGAAPGYSAWRIQAALNRRVPRNNGDYYNHSWNQAANGVALSDIMINSFNAWNYGTQIEPATVTGGTGRGT